MKSSKAVLTVVAAVILALAASAQATLLLYEPFDYPVGELLDGQTPPDGMGMTGSWTAGDSFATRDQLVVEGDGGVDGPGGANDPVPDVEWDGNAANIPLNGHFISIGGNGHVWGHITLASSVTDTFTDGSTTWMSCVSVQTDSPWGYWPMLAIGAGELIEDRGANAAGQAIGGGAYFNQGSAGAVGAHYWDNAIHAGAATVPSTINVRQGYPISWCSKSPGPTPAMTR